MLSLKDRLVFSFKKDNFKRIGGAFMRCLSFFYLFVKEFKGISGTRGRSSAGKSVPSRLWPAGSFGKGPIRSLMLAKLVVPLTTNTH